MSVSILGLLCLGMIATLFITMIVGTVVLLASNHDPRFWTALKKAGLVGLPIVGGLLFLTIFVGATWTHSRQAVHQEALVRLGNELHRTEEIHRLQEAREALEQPIPISHPGSDTPANDLRPVTQIHPLPEPSQVAIPSPSPQPVLPNPTGDLRLNVRPDWLTAGTTKEGYVTTTVLSSALFATEQEADEDAKRRFRDVIVGDVLTVGNRSGLMGFGTLPIDTEKLLPVFLRDRYVESETRNLGSVTAPMYRVWLKVEQSPQTEKQLTGHYRQYLTQFRMRLVGLIAAGFLTIPVVVLGTGQGIRATRGRGKAVWKLAGTLTVVAVWLVGFYLLRSSQL